jgi:hypothetical protein
MRLVEFTTHDGARLVYVNPDHILWLRKYDSFTRIVIGNNLVLDVLGSIDDVVARLGASVVVT